MIPNQCPKTDLFDCLYCHYYSPEFVIQDDSGRKCLKAYTDLGYMSHAEIGKVLGIKKSMVSIIYIHAIKKMRRKFGVPLDIKIPSLIHSSYGEPKEDIEYSPNYIKECRTCGEAKPLRDFYTKKESRDGHTGDCKKCFIGKVQKRNRELAELETEIAA